MKYKAMRAQTPKVKILVYESPQVKFPLSTGIEEISTNRILISSGESACVERHTFIQMKVFS